MAVLSRRTLVLTGVLSPLLSVPAGATPPAFEAAYRLNLGGLTLGEATMTVRDLAVRYEAAATVRLSGMARWLFDGEATAQADGRLAGGGLSPERFDADARFGDDRYRIGMRFAPLPEVSAEPPLRKRPYDASPEAARGALDPLSAAVALCLPLPAESLDGRTVGIYDARRRVDVVIGPVREAGGALHGVAELRRVAGFKAKHLAEPPLAVALTWTRQGSDAVLSRAVAQTPLGAAVATRRL
jgi:hypothetical protein